MSYRDEAPEPEPIRYTWRERWILHRKTAVKVAIWVAVCSLVASCFYWDWAGLEASREAERERERVCSSDCYPHPVDQWSPCLCDITRAAPDRGVGNDRCDARATEGGGR